MAKHALDAGLNVPEPVWEALEAFSGKERGDGPDGKDASPPAGGHPEALPGGMSRLATA